MNDFANYIDGMEDAFEIDVNAFQDGSISGIVDAYQAARDEKDRLEAELKAAKKKLDTMKAVLVDAMLDDETDSIGRNGRRYTLVSKTEYSRKPGSEEALKWALRGCGLGDLVVETVNPRTLNSAMKQMVETEGEISPILAACLNVYEHTDISVRKG